MVQEGDPAPDFELPTDNGEKLKLSQLKGKPVVVYFYPKDDTSGCTSEAKDFTALAGQFGKAGVTVIGVSPDSVESHREVPQEAQPEGQARCRRGQGGGQRVRCLGGEVDVWPQVHGR